MYGCLVECCVEQENSFVITSYGSVFSVKKYSVEVDSLLCDNLFIHNCQFSEMQVPKKDFVETFKPSMAKKMANRAKILEKLDQQKKEDEKKKEEALKLQKPLSAFGDISAMLASLMETKQGVGAYDNDDHIWDFVCLVDVVCSVS